MSGRLQKTIMCCCFFQMMGLKSEEQQTEMTHISSDMCEMQLNGVSEVMDLLHIDVETDVVEDRPIGGSFSLFLIISLLQKLSFSRARELSVRTARLLFVINKVSLSLFICSF